MDWQNASPTRLLACPLLVSETTDRECLRTILADAETRQSPDSLNRDDPDEAWRLLRIGGSTARHPEESYLDWMRRLVFP